MNIEWIHQVANGCGCGRMFFRTFFTALLEVGIAGEAVDVAGHAAGQLRDRSDRSGADVGYQRGWSTDDSGQESAGPPPDALVRQTYKVFQTQRHRPRQCSRRSWIIDHNNNNNTISNNNKQNSGWMDGWMDGFYRVVPAILRPIQLWRGRWIRSAWPTSGPAGRLSSPRSSVQTRSTEFN